MPNVGTLIVRIIHAFGHDASVDGGNRSSWQPYSIEMVGVEARQFLHQSER